MHEFIFITLTLGIIALSILVVAITVQHKKETVPSKEETVVRHRFCRPKYTSVPSNPKDAREEMVDYLLKRKHLTLAEKQYIYDYLMDTGKEKWRYIEGYWGYYKISSTGIVESCRRRNYLDPSFSNGRYQVLVSVGGSSKGLSVHKVVAETFIPNPNGAVSVRPKDGNYLHCDVRNLVWKPRGISTRDCVKKELEMAA